MELLMAYGIMAGVEIIAKAYGMAQTSATVGFIMHGVVVNIRRRLALRSSGWLILHSGVIYSRATLGPGLA
jgi:hypothetical protein